MRLIDADKIDYIMGEKPSSLDYVRRAHIADEPTVEAIPIEWIYDYIFHMSNIFGPMDISTMVRKYKEGFKPSVPEKGPIK